ncbi:MAG: DUF5666 domain-containing protein [Acidobacteriaceae bacterium]
MKMRFLRCAGLALCVLFASGSAVPALRAQDAPPPQQQGPGGGRGMGMFMGGNGVHGTVTTVSGNEITVKDEEGQVYKIETGPNTHFRKDRQEAKISDLHAGDVVVAMGNMDDQSKTLGAMFVIVLDPQQAARMEQMRADFGKTWTTGRVTAIKDLTLTVERPDKLTQTITVNENTEFRKRGPDGPEDIAFPDIKVGDRVTARGALQSDTFVATELTVMVPGERGAGRTGGGQPGQGGQPGATQPQPQPQPNGPQN